MKVSRSRLLGTRRLRRGNKVNKKRRKKNVGGSVEGMKKRGAKKLLGSAARCRRTNGKNDKESEGCLHSRRSLELRSSPPSGCARDRFRWLPPPLAGSRPRWLSLLRGGAWPSRSCSRSRPPRSLRSGFGDNAVREPPPDPVLRDSLCSPRPTSCASESRLITPLGLSPYVPGHGEQT